MDTYYLVNTIRRYKNGVLIESDNSNSVNEWPLVLLPLKLVATENDRGAGDVIARIIGPVGGKAFKEWYKEMFGRHCGCGNRIEGLNKRWPLRKTGVIN